jgi:hypothetical protein
VFGGALYFKGLAATLAAPIIYTHLEWESSAAGAYWILRPLRSRKFMELVAILRSRGSKSELPIPCGSVTSSSPPSLTPEEDMTWFTR